MPEEPSPTDPVANPTPLLAGFASGGLIIGERVRRAPRSRMSQSASARSARPVARTRARNDSSSRTLPRGTAGLTLSAKPHSDKAVMSRKAFVPSML